MGKRRRSEVGAPSDCEVPLPEGAADQARDRDDDDDGDDEPLDQLLHRQALASELPLIVVPVGFQQAVEDAIDSYDDLRHPGAADDHSSGGTTSDERRALLAVGHMLYREVAAADAAISAERAFAGRLQQAGAAWGSRLEADVVSLQAKLTAQTASSARRIVTLEG